MKRSLMTLGLLLGSLTLAQAATVPAVLSWHAPATRSDNSLLPAAQIAKHTVKCGLQPGKYTLKKDVAMPALTTNADFAVEGWDGYRYCVVTATNRAGEESAASSEIRFFVSSGQALADDPRKFDTAARQKDTDTALADDRN